MKSNMKRLLAILVLVLMALPVAGISHAPTMHRAGGLYIMPPPLIR